VFRSRLLPVVVTVIAVLATVGVDSKAGAIDLTSPPRISIGRGSVVEGQMNRRYISFPVTLSWPAPGPISVAYATGAPGDDATPGVDYRAKSGTFNFKLRQRAREFGVLIFTDFVDEGDENFTVHLSNAIGATIAVADGTGTIIDDDPYAGRRISIGDDTTPEICSGRPVMAPVNVTLSAMSGAVETINVTTGPTDTPSAVAGVDYLAVNKTLSLTIGQLEKVVRIPIIADVNLEGPEQFKVTLTLVSGTTPIKRSEGIVTILDCQPT
jgi:large repetitive protein